MMLYDELNGYYRPIWANEWNVQIEVKDDKDAQIDTEKYNPYLATNNDIDNILENGLLEWENDGNSWYVKIWW
jgi:hypothetical protein